MRNSPEQLGNGKNQNSGDRSAWDDLKDMSRDNGDKAQEINNNASESDNETFEADGETKETDLSSPDKVLSDVQTYGVKNGRVYDKETGEEITDGDAVARIKASKFLFKKAKGLRDREKHTLGNSFNDRGADYYIEKTLTRYGFDGDEPQFAEGKMLKQLVENGSFKQGILGTSPKGESFGMFVGEGSDYGKAVLDLKLRQEGKTLENVEVKIDDSNYKKDGISIADVSMSAKSKEMQQDVEGMGSLHHPSAEQLSMLEKEYEAAAKRGDETVMNGARAAMKMVVERNRLEVSPEEWENLSREDRERFIKIKIKECKVLGDLDEYKYWKANLDRIRDI